MATQKENSVSARIQRRKPVIGEKSGGGKPANILSTSNTLTDFFSPDDSINYFTHSIAAGNIASGKQQYTKPSAITRNIIRARKQYGIPGVAFTRHVLFGPENPFFRETVIFYHHKKNDMPHKKTLKNSGTCYFSDIKNTKRRKSTKGTMKHRIKVKDY